MGRDIKKETKLIKIKHKVKYFNDESNDVCEKLNENEPD